MLHTYLELSSKTFNVVNDRERRMIFQKRGRVVGSVLINIIPSLIFFVRVIPLAELFCILWSLHISSSGIPQRSPLQ